MRATKHTLALLAAVAVGGFIAQQFTVRTAFANADSGSASIATCAVPQIVNELMASDRFSPARDELAEKLREEIKPIAEQGQALFEEMQGMSPEDEGAQEKVGQMQRLRQQLGQMEQQAAAQLETFTAKQIAECFELARSSAGAVADDLGYDYVIATVGEDEDLNTDSVETVLRQMLARPVLHAPEDADITDDVREDLNLE